MKGIFEFELKVTDAEGLSSKDTVQVIVSSGTPTAICGSLSQTLLGTLSIPRSWISILTADNKIVFAGGYVGGIGGPPLDGASPRVDIYNKSTQSWSTADLSINRFHLGTIAWGNKIFFAGGDNGRPCSRIDIYDALNNTWSTAELSEARTNVIAVAAGNKILFAGGNINSTIISNKVDIYDQSNGTWSTATLSQPIAGNYYGKYSLDESGVISVGNKIYFITGDHNIDVYDALTNAWSELIVSPDKLLGARIVSIGNKIYFSGTAHINTSPDYANTLEVYDISADTWSSINMIQQRNDMEVIAADDKIFWAGGKDSIYNRMNGEDYGRCIDNIEIYDINTNSHSLLSLPAGSGCEIESIKTNDKIFFATSNNYVEIYDIKSHAWSSCNTDLFNSLAIGNTVYALNEYANGGLSNQVWKLEF